MSITIKPQSHQPSTEQTAHQTVYYELDDGLGARALWVEDVPDADAVDSATVEAFLRIVYIDEPALQAVLDLAVPRGLVIPSGAIRYALRTDDLDDPIILRAVIQEQFKKMRAVEVAAGLSPTSNATWLVDILARVNA